MMQRAVSPVIGLVCLLAVTVALAATVGTIAPVTSTSSPTVTAVDIDADSNGEIRLSHRGGDSIDPDSVELHVSVDDEPLAEQPPIPFFSASGFESAPTGAFNSASETPWRAGETAAFRIAGTNAPTLQAGATVEVELYVDGYSVAKLETTV